MCLTVFEALVYYFVLKLNLKNDALVCVSTKRWRQRTAENSEKWIWCTGKLIGGKGQICCFLKLFWNFNFGLEIYLRSIGLIWHNFLSVEYQPQGRPHPCSVLTGNFGLSVDQVVPSSVLIITGWVLFFGECLGPVFLWFIYYWKSTILHW